MNKNLVLRTEITRMSPLFVWLNLAIIANTFLAVSLYSQISQFKVAPLFQDNMVLQQQYNASIWGKGIPGTKIMLQASWGVSASAVVSSDSNWTTKIQTPKAGGPFQIFIQHDKSQIVIRNILAGEVWLCSGQSNMEMPLEGWPPSDTIINSNNDIRQALYPSIRMFSVMRAYEAAPREVCIGNWAECSPVDARNFSATAFYFGRSLYEKLKVPIGLINASYGGTSIEAWTSKEGLKSFPEFAEPLKKLAESGEGIRSLTQWMMGHPSIEIKSQDPLHKWDDLKFGDDECSNRTYNDSSWPQMNLPVLWERTSLGEFDGAIWFRKQIVLPSEWIGKDLVLQLGPIDDMDETYVNGKKVGQYLSDGFWSTNREYKVIGSIVQDSVFQIAVRVIDFRGGGGPWGNGTRMVLYRNNMQSGISLEGSWKYLPVAEYRTNVFYVFGAAGNEFANRPKFPIEFSANTPTALYNAMINPLVPFAIKGAIWYQGENNVPNPGIYYKLLPEMISDWRRLFACGDFPFYFVQIAPYDYGTQSHSELIREAQMNALSVKNTGMVSIMDIGNPRNIHPANKADVGKRLAQWALVKTYGNKGSFSGPIYKSMKNQKGKIILSFNYSESGLFLKYKNGENNFLIAGEDKIFKKANVKITGNNLIVSHPEILKPAAVRYAWSNTDEGTLFNKEGLPASSFRTDEWTE